MKLLKKGKVKDVYELDDRRILFVFSDRISSFDVILPSKVLRKGEVLSKFTKFWFEKFDVENHFIGMKGKSMMIVKKLNMIPIECIVRGYIYGSLYERMKSGGVELGIEPILAKKLPKPLFDPTTKSDVKDVPITKEEMVNKGITTKDEADWIEKTSIKLYGEMSNIADKSGFIIADVKFEFGRLMDRILLADSLGPDEFRLWPKNSYEGGKVQMSFDKQLVRDWLMGVGYKEALDKARKAGLPLPEPPKLPDWLIEETKRRYIEAYERITGRSIDERT